MNVLHSLVCVHVPSVLQSVPIPKTFRGCFSLSSAIAYSVCYTARSLCSKNLGHINRCYKKEQAKCVDIVDIESIDQKKVFCRCWLSSKFPYCDGSHNKHNEETGDNVGPLIIEPKKTL
uniref:CDGSH iron-sulfur domain-containing protein 2 homolog A n=1 Tax=Schistocephalus solidus TaxID=70667 RepID=A0A0X3NH02_SCHSO